MKYRNPSIITNFGIEKNYLKIKLLNDILPTLECIESKSSFIQKRKEKCMSTLKVQLFSFNLIFMNIKSTILEL